MTIAAHTLPNIDRSRLLELDEPEAITELEKALCELYLSMIGEADTDISVVDTAAPLVFESLAAAELHTILDAWLGVTVPLPSLLLEGLSIHELSTRLITELHAQPEDGGLRAAVPTLVADRTSEFEEFELAEIQQAYWIGRDQAFELGGVHANLYVELTVIDFDVERAERALDGLIERHSMLRSVIGSNGRQRILPEAPPFHIEVVDQSTAGADEVDAIVAAARAELAHRPTRPDDWQPFQMRLVKLAGAQAKLLISVDMVKIDAWSVQLLLGEFFAQYDDPDSEIPKIELTFRDYVSWNTEMRRTEGYERAKEYWLDRVASLPAAPDLPLQRPLASIAEPTFSSRGFGLDKETWGKLKARGLREGITPSILLCAAYTEVLATWGRNQRFTISVAGGRPYAHPEITRVLGPFARPMLLEVDGTAPGGFRGRARALQRQISMDFEHRDFAGLDLLRELGKERGRDRALMPVIFTSLLPQGGEGGLPTPDWLVSDLHVQWGMPQLMLENQMLEVDGALLITWVTVDDVLPADVVTDMFEAYQQLLQTAATDREVWTAESLELLPAEQVERREDYNATLTLVPDGLLHRPFLDQVAERGDEPAVIAGGRTLSYAELDRHARAVGCALVDRAVQPNTLVAVCMDRGWEQVVAVLGVLRSGAAYLPIDPELPGQRINELLELGQVKYVLTQPSVEARLSWPDTVERITVAEDDLSADNDYSIEDSVSPADLAYVIFTSGSTGVPKGVMIDHRGALNTVLDINDHFGVGPQDRVLAVSDLNFDLSVYDIFGTLAAGGTIVVPDTDRAKDPAHWSELIGTAGVTVWNSVPALFNLLVSQCNPPAGSLRLAMLSGDWIPVDLPTRAVAALGNPEGGQLEVISLGGATEASIWSIYHRITEADQFQRSIPYGRPLSNQGFHVLNERMEPCPEWVTGSLYISGVGLAKGYWGDEIKTAAAFITHPHTGEKLYRTGDLGRYLPSGDIEFIGRDDNQVKVNGYRIELGEIESVLQQHSGVTAAVAVMLGDREEGKSLAAYVVPAGSNEAAELVSELRAFLTERLPGYEVPAHIIELAHLPLTRNGKVDRAALPRPALAVATPTEQPPRTELETVLATIMAAALDLERVGIEDNLFELGGTSLSAVRMVDTARQAGIQLSVGAVIHHPTVAGLAAVIETGTE